MEWKRIDDNVLERISQRKTNVVKGINFTVMVSPYAIPVRFKGEYNRERKVFEIRFQYLDEEPSEFRKADDQIDLLVGKNSGRLMGIDVDVHTLGVEFVGLVLQELPKQVSAGDTQTKRANFEAVREVIDSTKDSLLAELAAG